MTTIVNLKDAEQADAFLKENTASITCEIHPSMFAILGPSTWIEVNNEGYIQENMIPCNHNTLNKTKVMSIMNNILGNPLGVKNGPAQDWGTDAELLVAKWDKVSLYVSQNYSTRDYAC